MKVAKLVEFNIVVRVLIDDSEKDNAVIYKARQKVLTGNTPSYVCVDNVVLIEDDTECPYNPILE